MRNTALHLAPHILTDKVEQLPTRDGFGHGVVAAGTQDPRVVVLCADLAESTRAEWFQKEFPERFIEMGVAEQNMATVAAGMALAGKIPFITSYAAFNPGRNYEQIRTTIALNQVPVKVCGMHAGVSVGPDGATHQMLEDIGLMRMLPGMVVLAPGDAEEARKATLAALAWDGPVYLRFGRSATPVFTTSETPFSIGRALTLWQSARPKVALMATGALSYTALLAAEELGAAGIEATVLHVPTIKPLDEPAVLEAARTAGCVITLEEHQVMGGFGSAIAEYLSARLPVPVVRLGVQDQFGQSGTPEELLTHYGLDTAHVCAAARDLVKKVHQK